MVDVTITLENNDFTNREIEILEVLFLNLAAFSNFQVVKKDLALNPIEEKEKDAIFKHQFAWQSSISPELFEEFIEAITRRYVTAIKMCGFPEAKISFNENSYLLNK